MTGKKLF